jgi:hypothetical protein
MHASSANTSILEHKNFFIWWITSGAPECRGDKSAICLEREEKEFSAASRDPSKTSSS